MDCIVINVIFESDLKFIQLFIHLFIRFLFIALNRPNVMSKKSKNSIAWSTIQTVSKNWKEGSIFRVVRLLNEQKELLTACNLKKGEITIDYLKSLSPDYFTMNKKDKKGVVSVVPRDLFNPRVFAIAMRKKYGEIPAKTVVITEKKADKAKDKKAA